MVEIIKRGMLPGDVKFKSTCSNCKTEFSFTRSEATDGSGCDQRDAGLLKISCPVCNRDCFVNGNSRSNLA